MSVHMRVICMDRKNIFIFSGEIFFTKILSNIEAGDSIRFAWCETNNEVITLSAIQFAKFLFCCHHPVIYFLCSGTRVSSDITLFCFVRIQNIINAIIESCVRISGFPFFDMTQFGDCHFEISSSNF